MKFASSDNSGTSVLFTVERHRNETIHAQHTGPIGQIANN